MPLPAWAEPDREGVTTYPRALGSVAGANKLHVLVDTWRAACGVVTDGHVDFIGKRRPVCVECRRESVE